MIYLQDIGFPKGVQTFTGLGNPTRIKPKFLPQKDLGCQKCRDFGILGKTPSHFPYDREV